MFSEKFEQLYRNIPKLKNIKTRTLKKIESDRNNIGFLTVNSDNLEYGIKNICWVITSLEIKFNRIYIYADSSVTPEQYEEPALQNVLKLFSDVLVFFKPETITAENSLYQLIQYNLNNNIYVFKPYGNYVTLKPKYGTDKMVYSLSYSKQIQRYNYNKSIFTIVQTEGVMQEIHGESLANPLCDDFYIPAYVLKQEWLDKKIDKYNSLSNYLSIIFTINGVKKNYYYENVDNKIHNYMSFDNDVVKYLRDHIYQKSNWEKTFPNYMLADFNFDLCAVNMEIAFVNSFIHYVTVENINNIRNLTSGLFSSIRAVDNVDLKYYEKHLYNNLSLIKKTVPLTIDYNNKNQLFDRKPAYNPNRLYGAERFDQTLKYLIETTKSDILYVIGDKIVLNKPISFNVENIWAGTLYNDENSGYINIFNIKKMKECGIVFETTKKFMEDIKDMKHEFIDYTKYGICFPQDFDKYNSVFFQAAYTHKSIVFNYLFDKFNYKFKSFDYDYIRDNQL